MAGLRGFSQGMGRRGTQLGAFLQTLPEGKKAAPNRPRNS